MKLASSFAAREAASPRRRPSSQRRAAPVPGVQLALWNFVDIVGRGVSLVRRDIGDATVEVGKLVERVAAIARNSRRLGRCHPGEIVLAGNRRAPGDTKIDLTLSRPVHEREDIDYVLRLYLGVVIDHELYEEIGKLAGIGRMQEAAGVELRVGEALRNHLCLGRQSHRAPEGRLFDNRPGLVRRAQS